MTPLRESLLFDILSQPTAPFREKLVISTITKELDSHSVPYFQDKIGNIILGVSSQSDYLHLVKKKSPEPVRFYIAHMDHPGFHGVRWKSPLELEVKWHGGSPTQHLNNSKVWLSHKSSAQGMGELKEARLLASNRAIDTATVKVSKDFEGYHPTDIFGGFGFRAPYWKDGDLIYTKAADDLVGAFAITSLAVNLFSKKLNKKKPTKEIPFLGLLTRAEEVGFIGAIGHFKLGWLKQAKRKIVCVSLETSRTLPGAEIGKGPVVRLGDRFTVFDPSALHVFSNIAQTILPGKHQKRIMDGGSCEATAATVFGLTSIGISVPLGNYHNQSLEGGPDAAPPNGPAPEFVHTQDIQGLLELCQALLKPKLPWTTPWKTKIKEFEKSLREYQPLLRSGL